MSRRRRQMLAAAAMGLLVSGCDKCGNPVKINTPAWPKACYGDAAESQGTADKGLFPTAQGNRL